MKRWSILLMSLLALLLPLSLLAAPAQRESENVGPVNNSLDLREYKLGKLPGASLATEMYLYCVQRGEWNGQSLAGLTLAYVPARSVGAVATLYIVNTATDNQRLALVAALRAADPVHFAPSTGLRVLPAAIEFEQLNPRLLIIHVAPVV
jgi:hypothetical protein